MPKKVKNINRFFIALCSFTMLAVLLMVIFVSSSKSTVQAQSPESKQGEEKFNSNIILVKLKDSSAKTLRSRVSENAGKKIDFTKEVTRAAGLESLDSLAKENNFQEIEPASANLDSLKEDSGEKQKEAKNTLGRWYIVKLNKENKQIKKDSKEFSDLEATIAKLKKLDQVETAEPNAIVTTSLTPNDTYFLGQDALQRIQAPQAWDVTLGSSNVKVAIFDTGIQTNHPDLIGRVAGSVDYTGSPLGAGDVVGHGTSVAGIIAANINNATGIAGVSPGVSLLNVKTCNDTGDCSNPAAISNGIAWAVSQGANVINMSFGGNQDCVGSNQFWQDNMTYAYASGVVLVAAAGNAGANDVDMPANCNYVVSVTGTNSTNDASAGYNYGTAIDIAAPTFVSTTTKDSGYVASFAGTSAATPHVSAVAALVKSSNPNFTNYMVIDRVLNNADPITGTGTNWSHGRVNAYRAVSPSVYGTVVASANPCVMAVGASTCTSTLSWNATNATNLTIYIRENPGSYVYNGTTASGSIPITWVTTSGATFDLYANNSTLPLATVHVYGVAPGTISASPNPCSLNGQSACNSTITWSTPSGTPDVKIRIRENPGSLMSAGPNGSQNVPWITATGATFDLYSGTTLLKSVFVKGI